MAYYGGRGNYYGRQGYPARSPNVIYNPYGNVNRPNIQPAYVNRGFNQSPYYPGGYGQPPRRQPAIAPLPQPRAQPQPRNTRMLILCVIISVIAVLLILGIVGAIVGVVLSAQRPTTLPPTTQPPELTTASLSVTLNMEYSPALANPSSDEYQELAMQFETEMARPLKAEFGDQFVGVKVTSFRPGSIVVPFTVQVEGPSDPAKLERITRAVQQAVSGGMLGSLSVDPNSVQVNTQPTQGPVATQAPQPQPTQAPQPQPTQAPQPQPTQAPQPQPTQAPQPQPTQAPQPQPTQAPQPQPTQAPQPQPTQAPQPQPTQAPQPQPTQAPQPQPTVAPPPIEGDIFSTRICGTQPALANRIIGGTNAQLGDWPWIGSLEEDGSHAGCGATLLNERWAITATHCFLFSMADIEDGAKPPDSIVFGITNTRTPESGSQTRGFRAFHHPNYDIDDPDTKFDITLLRLSETVSFTDNINPICLATLVEETTMYENCKAAGWGNTRSTGDPVYPDELKEVNLPLISSATCGISSDIICAGAPQGGIDTCQGDSGGPLICENRVDDSWHLVGITSSGEGCGLPNSSASYTRVTQFIDWIQSTVSANP